MLDTFLQRITEPTPRLSSSFGSVIKFSDSGNVMLVNAPALSSNPQVIGKTYIYNRSGTQWAFLEEIVYPAFVTALDHPSSYCEMNFDGTILAISIQDYDATPTTNGGVMIFALVGGTYVYRSLLRVNPRITPPSGNVLNIFGFHMAFDDAGKTLVVSAPFDINVAGDEIGGVYVFETLDAWNSFSYVELYHDENGDNLGLNVAISGDGKIIVAGRTSTTQPGSAPTWEKTGETWPDYADNIPIIATFTASDGVINDKFAFGDHLSFFIHTGGNSISINFDGSVIAFGAYFAGTGGQVYIFNRIPSAFTEYQKIVPASIDGNLTFGWGIKLNRVGTRLVVGAQGEDINAITDVGVNYIYQDDGNSFVEVDQISAPVPMQFSYGAFRPVISPDGKYLASGSIDETINGLTFAGVVNIWALGNVPINRPDKFAVLVKKEDANFQATTSQLSDVTSDVNKFYKFPGKKVANTDTGKTEITNGWSPQDPWVELSGSYSASVFTSGPISYWIMGDSSGTIAFDEILVDDQTYVNSPSLGQNGLVLNDNNTSVLFDSANEQYSSGTELVTNYSFTDGLADLPFSIEAQTNITIDLTNNPIFSKVASPGGGSNEYLFTVNPNGSVQVYLYSGLSSSQHYWVTSAGVINPLIVNYIVITYSGVLNSGLVYVNGVSVPVTRVTSGYTGMVSYPATEVRIGVDFLNDVTFESFFDGFLQHIAIFGKILQPIEINNRYEIGINKLG